MERKDTARQRDRVELAPLEKDGAKLLECVDGGGMGAMLSGDELMYVFLYRGQYQCFIHKLDAPSGTAITLAEEIVADLDRKTTWVKGEQHLADGTVEGTNDCAPSELAIESIRRDEVPGIHSVIYDSDADCITITHDAHSRKGFALGAVLAAEYTKDHEGLLTTKDLFKF